jgi:threonylcarbamoyladenosine tRNA methylthiotransferase CDKAL1
MSCRPEPTKVFVEGHGCSASFADTEIISGMINNRGYELVSNEKDADVAVLVTCTVKTVTEQRMLSRIRELSDGGRKKLVVAGCLPKADPDKILKIRSDFSLVGPNNLKSIVPAIESSLAGHQLISLEPSRLVKPGLPRARLNSTIGIVEISSGCLSSCTFCQVKLVKGTVFSYPEKEIVEEANTLVNQGAREIWLTSTDNAAYGRDSKSNLPSLVRNVSQIKGNFKIRLGMMNPLLTDRVMDDLLDCLKLDKVFKFVHLPVQSGSNRILKVMQRGYSVSDFELMVERVRKEIPGITLSTDMIVGFPSESDSEFEESMDLLRRVKPDVLNLSRFGARGGTKAAIMEDQTTSEVAKKRSTSMAALSKKLQNEINASWIGWTGKILLDENVRGAVVGRNFSYKPCLISLVERSADDYRLGDELEVEVTGATSSTLRVAPLSEIKKAKAANKC